MNHEKLFFARMLSHNPFWMGNPDSWVWCRADGSAQGFGLTWRKERDGAGMANMLWLSMDLDAKPRNYNARDNGLYSLLALHGAEMTLNTMPLFDMAGSLTVEQFHLACLNGKLETRPPVPNILPLLTLLAGNKVQHAHP